MKNNHDQTSEGLNQILEIVNAKGDKGELNEIVKRGADDPKKNDSPAQN
ncbi:hypothetical protein J6TS1_30190 [Siminovitchia terrae]|uniref:Uncharacterized protein n=1 Tax=Siminovitchia terrae TaxID=1914933 RepID=A0ABQ4KZP9_SIMTE|nr:hypothetical protein [Siminovitchia terrae]GIN92465.1 hypothetical protein J22TS1_35160 [Siminovitchia terrae]GIN97149.1 hypothetical protein J6TS1_30190 [Siminovitchia terrae]